MYDSEVLYRAFLYDTLATVLVFLLSFFTNNSSCYDPYWSIAPVPMLLYFISWSTTKTLSYLQVMVGGLVCIWSARLTYNWAVGFLRQSGATAEHGQDWRYVTIRDKFKRWGIDFLYWPVLSLLGIHLMPTVVVFLSCMSMHVAVHGNQEMSAVSMIGGVVSLTGIIFETVADEQLRLFTEKGASKTAIMQTGLWKYSRHPNYFGEVLFWIGHYIIAVGAAPQGWVWLSVGPLSMLALFFLGSIPLMEGKQVKKRPEYRKYQERTSMFIPWLQRRL